MVANATFDISRFDSSSMKRVSALLAEFRRHQRLHLGQGRVTAIVLIFRSSDILRHAFLSSDADSIFSDYSTMATANCVAATAFNVNFSF